MKATLPELTSNRLLLTLTECASMLNVSPYLLRKIIADGHLEVIPVYGTKRVRCADVVKLVYGTEKADTNE